MKKMIVLAIALATQTTFANGLEDSISFDEPISISGSYQEPQRPSAADRMKKMREKLERRNEILVKKQIEKIRLKKELEMKRRIQKIFDQQMKALEAIN